VDRFTGVEVDKRAIESARLNAEHMGHQNGHFIEGTTEDHIQALVDQHDAANTAIILDPPRKGCHQSILEVLIQAKPRQIIYVSCQPATLSRDIKTLCDSGVFEVHKVIPLDMFPQTQHVECVTDIRLRQKE
jgi:23S rRNA (uracil1939-C5)-methyltransferase